MHVRLVPGAESARPASTGGRECTSGLQGCGAQGELTFAINFCTTKNQLLTNQVGSGRGPRPEAAGCTARRAGSAPPPRRPTARTTPLRRAAPRGAADRSGPPRGFAAARRPRPWRCSAIGSAGRVPWGCRSPPAPPPTRSWGRARRAETCRRPSAAGAPPEPARRRRRRPLRPLRPQWRRPLQQ